MTTPLADNQVHAPRHIGEFVSHFFEDVGQKLSGVVHDVVEPAISDVLLEVEPFVDNLLEFTSSLRKGAELQVSQAKDSVDEVMKTVHLVVNAAGKLQTDIVTHGPEGIAFETVVEDLGLLFAPIVQQLNMSLQTAPGHDERQKAIHELLQMLGESIVQLGVKNGMEETVMRNHMDQIIPHVQAVVVLIGDLHQQHPILGNIVLFEIVTLILADLPVLGPFLTVLLGFSRRGPVKDFCFVAAYLPRRNTERQLVCRLAEAWNGLVIAAINTGGHS
ncbi:unnamed protein product [Somion occarium]|uniref:Uncharacterized protein n=1 Tax=Somion occarium TaxID=3059160 RepID=A0ABP1D837_9APHY